MSNLYALLEKTAQTYPDKTALEFGGHTLSYQKVKEASDRLAAGLQHMGIRPGDRMAVMLPNVPHTVLTFFALFKLGATIIPVSIHYKEEEIHHQLEDSEARGIVYPDRYRQRVYTALQGLDHCDYWVVLGGEAKEGEVRLTYLMETYEPLETSDDTHPDDTALIVYTAGTTGYPKGAELTHDNILANIDACGDVLQIESDSSVLAVLPLHHPLGNTLVLGTFFRKGGKVVLMPSFNAADSIRMIASGKITHFFGVPSMYSEMLDVGEASEKDLKSLQMCLSSGDGLRQEIMTAFADRFKIHILEGYGLTEASAIVSLNSPRQEQRAGSIGLPLPGVEMRIVNESGEDVKTGQVGEIIVQAPSVMKGYLNKPEATKDVLKDGWLYTGDLARLDESGFGIIVVRKKTVIVKSGFSIYPREVERYLLGHPKIREAIVVGIPDPAFGEEIHAVVVLKDGETAGQDEIVEYIRERMATYKCPRIIHFAGTLPKGPTGRIMRDQVRHDVMNASIRK